MDNETNASLKPLFWLLFALAAFALQWAAAHWLPEKSRLKALLLRLNNSVLAFWLLFLLVAAVGTWLAIAYS